MRPCGISSTQSRRCFSSAEVVCRANDQEILSYCIISKSHPYRKTGPTQQFIPEPILPHASELSPSLTPSCHWPWQLSTLKPSQPTLYSLEHESQRHFGLRLSLVGSPNWASLLWFHVSILGRPKSCHTTIHPPDTQRYHELIQLSPTLYLQ